MVPDATWRRRTLRIIADARARRNIARVTVLLK
jgi:hypothetical protein